MNEVLSQLHARKSVRAFLDRPISPEARRAILEAACAAPTAGNQQLYTILDITDQAVKDTLADTCDHQPFIAQAPLVLLFCADCQKWYDAFAAGGCSPRRPGPGDLWLALSDANIAAQNAVTAAWSLGIGSCYIGDILEQVETHRTLLRLPEDVGPAALLASRRPSEQAPGRDITVTVPQGQKDADTIHELKIDGLMDNELAMRVQMKFYDYEIHPGTYTLNTSMSSKKMLQILNEKVEEGEDTAS